ncbi:MAG: Na/Pi symporter [Gemmataceae bacterium]|nr:Na/Pi symporter [Gemmataceae bacterium]
MDIAGQILLGLGVFFVGMRLVGDNLRHLSSRSFRSLVARSTASGARAAGLGFVFGALMQSATAVTFILVNMVGSGLITSRQALPVISWANVGLTAIGFVAGLNIHTLVLYLIGVAGLGIAFIKKPGFQLQAGVVLGIGLVLYGLQTIAAGAAPLHDFPWFDTLLNEAVHAPLLAFGAGVLMGFAVQSNTAAALIVIALAQANALTFSQASMVIYGTNLGTIAMRVLLSADLRGSALQLVRFEDLFCLVSGVLMVILYYVETGLQLPLVGALARTASDRIQIQLAIVFLLSNLLPALLLQPFLGTVHGWLNRRWPRGREEEEAAPRYLHSRALGDPVTALDLLMREHARLLRHAGEHLAVIQASAAAQHLDGETIHQAFTSLASQVGDFTNDLARSPLIATCTVRLRLAQNVASIIGYLEESARDFASAFVRLPAGSSGVAAPLAEGLAALWAAGVEATDTLNADVVARLREGTRRHGPTADQLQGCRAKIEGEGPVLAEFVDLASAYELIVWMLHRLATVLADASARAVVHTAAVPGERGERPGERGA